MHLHPRLFLAAAALVLAPLAHAVSVTLNFTAQVDFLADPFPGLLAGQAITGSFTYESSTPDSNSQPFLGIYHDSITAAKVTVGSYTGTFGGLSYIYIANDAPIAPPKTVDGVDFSFTMTGNQVSNWRLQSLGVSVRTLPATVPSDAFSSDALPTSGADWPGAGSFDDSNQLLVVFRNSVTGELFSGNTTLTSLTAAAVPGTPDGGAVGALFALALGGLALARRRAYA